MTDVWTYIGYFLEIIWKNQRLDIKKRKETQNIHDDGKDTQAHTQHNTHTHTGHSSFVLPSPLLSSWQLFPPAKWTFKDSEICWITRLCPSQNLAETNASQILGSISVCVRSGWSLKCIQCRNDWGQDLRAAAADSNSSSAMGKWRQTYNASKQYINGYCRSVAFHLVHL